MKNQYFVDMRECRQEEEPAGLFAEPLWFRFPLAVFVIGAGLAMLRPIWQIARSGIPWAVGVVMLTVEPLAVFLLLLGGALLAPKSVFATWFRARRPAILRLIGFWLLVGAVGMLLYLLLLWTENT